MDSAPAEDVRLAEIARYEILDSPPEETFDRVVAIIRAVFGADFALITLVDRARCWYKAESGLGRPEMPRSDNMCDVVLSQDDVYVVSDADAATVDGDAVAPLRRLGLRFYAGAPLRTRSGVKIGTVCAVGSQPRDVTPEERMVLASLADIVSDELELRLSGRRIARAEEEMRRLNEELAAASKNKSEFLTRMAHELRAPLNGILGASELLEQGAFGPVNEQQRDYASDIHESGQHLLAIISDVLDLARIESGQLTLQREVLDVRHFLESCVAVVRGFAAAREVQIRVDAPSSGEMYGDERRLRQAACNLLGNAVKFSPAQASVRIAANEAGDEVVIAVEDEGPGIPDAYIGQIFDQFFQAPGGHEGTGLGLPVARDLVELNGGRIWFERRPGGGSRFAFTVPRARATAPQGDQSGSQSHAP